MCQDLSNLHRQAIAEVRREKAALEERLKMLAAVEHYHAEAIEAIPSREHSSQSGQIDDACESFNESLSRQMEGAKKYEAAEIALKHLNKPSRIAQIIQVLWDGGYATDVEKRQLHNTLYTGMLRRDDIFEKGEDGLWALREWQENEQPDD